MIARRALYKLLLYPIVFVLDIFFSLTYLLSGNPGFSIIVLSIGMNLLLLPIYKRGEELQEKEISIQKKMEKGLSHLKKTFKGDEAFMMISTFYRQHHYKPIYALRALIPVCIEIPFFLAAYQYLSNLQSLQNVHFGPIQNLAKADGLLTLAGTSINLLPIIMTVVNLLSSAVFARKYPKKTKIQLLIMALFFLVFLYQSPSGLVLYWTMNNLFSLLRNLFLYAKEKGVFGAKSIRKKRRGEAKKKKQEALAQRYEERKDTKQFVLYGFLLACLLGYWIPSGIIASSPEEFLIYTQYRNPNYFVLESFCFTLGFFILFLGIFYALGKAKTKVMMQDGLFALFVLGIMNYLLFAKDLGNLSPYLQFDELPLFSYPQIFFNLFCVFALIALALYLLRKKVQMIQFAAFVMALAMLVMGSLHVWQVAKAKESFPESIEVKKEYPAVSLSKEGKNVVVMMLDSALAYQLPFILDEKPFLKEQFSGFTFYPRTVSFSSKTNSASPAFYGGYEYIPEEINKRKEEKLVVKHNEALKVMPQLFENEGYKISVFDPTYANYKWFSDTSIFDDKPSYQTAVTKGLFTDISLFDLSVEAFARKLFLYSWMKTSPLVLQKHIYNQGIYIPSAMNKPSVQSMRNNSQADGIYKIFMDGYSALDALPSITKVEEGAENTFLMMSNDTAHDPMLLQKPDYLPQAIVDNRTYDADGSQDKVLDGKVLKMETKSQITAYHANMAMILQLAEWLEDLKAKGVYANTRIIFAADHGKALDQMPSFENEEGVDALSHFNPLLLVKDFDAADAPLAINDEFMTNADVPHLALKGIVDNPINPFTKKPMRVLREFPLDVMDSFNWGTSTNSGNTFLPDHWYRLLSEDIFNPEEWVDIGIH